MDKPRDPATQRLINRFSAKKLGAALGITQSAVSQWRKVPLSQCVALAAMFHLTPHELRPDLWDQATTLEEMAQYILVRDSISLRKVLPENPPLSTAKARLCEWEILNSALERLRAEALDSRKNRIRHQYRGEATHG